MFYKKAHTPAKGCIAEFSTLTGLILNILNIFGFFTEYKDYEIPIISPVITWLGFLKDDLLLWEGLIVYGLTIVMMVCLSFLEEQKEQPIGRMGAFMASGFVVVFVSPGFIYPLFSTFSIFADFHGALRAISIIVPAIVSGWVLYHFFNR